MNRWHEPVYSRPETPEDRAFVELVERERAAGREILLPLCSTFGCEKLRGHEDDHGPIEFNIRP